MWMHVCLRSACLLIALVCVLAITLSGAQADVVLLKDGFALQGKVKREVQTFVDPASGQVVDSAKLDGFFLLDDEARRIIFSRRQVEDVTDSNPSREADTIRLARPFTQVERYPVPNLERLLGITPWDAKWERHFKAEGPQGRIDITQRMTVLTPYLAKVQATRYTWYSYFLTREFDPAAVRSLLIQHPDLKLAGNREDAPKRLRIYRFFVQAGWYDEAEKELQEIQKDFPDQKEQVDTSRANLNKLRTLRLLDEIEQAHKAGRNQWAFNRLVASGRSAGPTLTEEGLDEKLVARVRTLKTLYEKTDEDLTRARNLLRSSLARLPRTDQRPWLTEAVAAILWDLHPDTLPRLEAFLRLAQQPAERPDHLLALAISGWLLGSGSAEDKVETARRLWQTRQFVLDYQKTRDEVARKGMLYAYQQKGEALAFDELAQLIRFLPPPEPFNLVSALLGPWPVPAPHWPLATLYWPVLTGHWPLRPDYLAFQANVPGSIRKGANYLVLLPPEYHPGRSYPVLFVLHEGNVTSQTVLRRWSPLAAQHGYLLVAPEWDKGLSGTYGYTTEEHAAVVDVLRDLRRRFRIDSDRVFLAGSGEGGNMAYDVGLSHPDLFAGVVPMAARPYRFAKDYWRNGQYLPFYVVDGDRDSDNAKEIRSQFRNWVPRGYPSLFVEYKGRGQEWFAAELPFIFDWMSRKKRAVAFPELGRWGSGGASGEEFSSMRTGDNRFYWLSGTDLSERHNNEGPKWKSGLTAAYLQARIAERNQISVHVRGFRNVTVWLGPGMIDFDKPVTIHVNQRIPHANRKVAPNLSTLLEDFYQRGDHQRLFWAKVELPVS
jgi:predicted esterase